MCSIGWKSVWKIFVCAAAAASVPLAAEPQWVTHQGARLVIGQDSFTRQNPKPSREVIGSAAGVATAGDRLFIAEGNRVGALPVNNRILIYNQLSGFLRRSMRNCPRMRLARPASACPTSFWASPISRPSRPRRTA